MEISKQQLEALRRLSTPTVSNAVELFNLRPRNEGYMAPEIRCLFPDLGVMVGYAVTARYAAREKPANPGSRYDFWNYILQFPEPRIVVMEDLDQPAGAGAYFGEVQTTIHKRLRCEGVVTNGHVRDLDEVHPMGFHYFAGGVCVSHAYVHLVDFGTPVTIGGLTVNSGDIIHGDKHGVMVVPVEAAREITSAAASIAERERRIMDTCAATEVSLEELRRAYESE
jgi:4-hydroxy-4-methyl-2-oxoglutarate aldolase